MVGRKEGSSIPEQAMDDQVKLYRWGDLYFRVTHSKIGSVVEWLEGGHWRRSPMSPARLARLGAAEIEPEQAKRILDEHADRGPL